MRSLCLLLLLLCGCTLRFSDAKPAAAPKAVLAGEAGAEAGAFSAECEARATLGEGLRHFYEAALEGFGTESCEALFSAITAVGALDFGFEAAAAPTQRLSLSPLRFFPALEVLSVQGFLIEESAALAALPQLRVLVLKRVGEQPALPALPHLAWKELD